MKSYKTNLDIAIAIYRLLKTPNWNDDVIAGTISYSSTANRLLLDAIEKKVMRPIVRSNGSNIPYEQLAKKIEESDEFEITLTPPRNVDSTEYFAKDVEDVVSVPAFLVAPPNQLYLAECDRVVDPDNPDKQCSNVSEYFQLVAIVNRLIEYSDYQNTDGPIKLVFFGKKKIELTIQCTLSDLMSITNCENAEFEFHPSHPVYQKRQIIKNTLIDFLDGYDDKMKFSRLLSGYDLFVEKYNDNYNLFLNEIVYDEIKEEVEIRNGKFIVEINKTFADIQNKLLAIPLAIILVMTQMKSDESLKNWLLYAGSAIFVVLMFMLVSNQKDTLSALKVQYMMYHQNLNEKYKAVSEKFVESNNQVEKRYSKQNRNAIIIYIILGTFLTSASYFLIKYNFPNLLPNWISL